MKDQINGNPQKAVNVLAEDDFLILSIVSIILNVRTVLYKTCVMSHPFQDHSQSPAQATLAHAGPYSLPFHLPKPAEGVFEKCGQINIHKTISPLQEAQW
jgi:hypothetical protein